ncbi:MAG TPA: indolepyruvate ferredoxin oxidoreductase family protein, partial [Luteimonas sp.]|nr:indolepyruvate ferredoxin oxidoreductase family protein [Luteimonas sp.]
GLVPLSFESLMRAVELNGAAVEMNKTAFAWGRLAAIDPEAVYEAAGVVRNAPTAAENTPRTLDALPPGEWESTEWGATSAPKSTRAEDELRHVPAHAGTDALAFLPLDDLRLSRSLDELIARRVDFLTEYQDAKYAKRYADFVAKVREAERVKAPGSTDLSEAVARYFFKLMAYKDEYEVARLYTSGEFLRRIEQQFDGDYKLRFHLAPPLLAKRNDKGELVKREYGPWMLKAFGLLAKLRFLRGGTFDVFGRTEERRMERALIDDYERTIGGLLDRLDGGNVDLAAEIAGIPEHIRGYGHVKEAHLHAAKAREMELLKEWDNPLRIVRAA